MKISTTKMKIRCEMVGCNNLADVFIIKSEKCYDKDAIKLCDKCAKELYSSLKKHYSKKGANNGESENN